MSSERRAGGWLAGLPSPRQGLRRLVARTRVRRYLRRGGEAKLHIGCGEHILDGWLNTDVAIRHPLTVFMDARRALPLPSDRFELVYAEHMIEHLTLEQGEAMLREISRVLRPGGWLRIATPDLRFLLALHAPARTVLQDRYLDWSIRHSALPSDGRPREAIVINHFFRAWGHQFIYDEESLTAALRAAGFVDPRTCPVQHSEIPDLCDIESHGRIIPPEFNRLETLVMEARKPQHVAGAPSTQAAPDPCAGGRVG
jgi:predicted SAM-dependent methyltransferase